MELNLTPSQENYLEHIWHLSSQGFVRVVELADSVGVKRPSVTRAVNNLVSMGLVRHEHYGVIEFTAEGYRAARYIVRRDACLQRFLTQVLQFDDKQANDEVCRLEHAVGDSVLRRLELLANYIDRHGNVKVALAREMKRCPSPAEGEPMLGIGTKPHV